MRRKNRDFLNFCRLFFFYAYHIRGVLLGLITLVLFGGLLLSWAEQIELGKAVYLACITGLTIGYGDITPETALGRVTCVGIGLIGILFTGMTIAIATRALADSVRPTFIDHSSTNQQTQQQASHQNDSPNH